MFQLYDFVSSGNGYKVRLVLNQLRRPYAYHETNILEGATHTSDFLKLNPNGKIPLLITPDGDCLSESNAIICYLAENTPLMPSDALERARIMQWLFWEQYSHEPYIATTRFWVKYCEREAVAEKIADRHPGALKALQIMEDHLQNRDFFVGNRYSLADIALYAYTHVADEGGFDLSQYPAILAWLKRVQQQPHHITIQETEYQA